VVDSQYLGAEIRLTCQLDVGGNLVVSVPSTQARIVSRDEVVALTWDSSAVFEVSDS